MATEKAIIELDSNVTNFLSGINRAKKLNKEFEDSQKKVNKSSLEFSEISKGVKNGISSIAGVAKKATVAMLAVKAALIATGEASAQMAKEIKLSAELSKVSVGEMQQLSFATNTVGISMEKMGDISKDTLEKIGDFINTGGGGFQDFADAMGLTKKQATAMANEFKTLSGPEVLQQMVSKMQEAGLSSVQMSHALEGMASDTTNLIPLFRNNGEELNKLKKEFNETVVALTSADLKKLEEMSVNFGELKTTFDNTLGKISVTFADQINAITENTRKGLKIVGDEFASGSFKDRLNSFYSAFSSSWSAAFVTNIEIFDNFKLDFEGVVKSLSRAWLEFILTLPIQFKKAGMFIKELFADIADEIAITIAEINVKINEGLNLIGLGDLEGAQLALDNIKMVTDARDEQHDKEMQQLEDEKNAIIAKFDAEQQAATKKREDYAAGAEARIELDAAETDAKIENLERLTGAQNDYNESKGDPKKDSKVAINATNSEKNEQKKALKDKADNIKNFASVADSLNQVMLNDNKAVKAGVIVADTAAGVMNQYSQGDPYTAFARAAAVAATGAVQLSNLMSSGKGGGNIGHNSTQSQQSAPQREVRQTEFANITVDSVNDRVSGTQNVKFDVDTGDSLLDVIAEQLEKRMREGR